MRVEEDIEILCGAIKRVGEAGADGSYTVTFGKLFDDDKVQNELEALMGTLKAARKQGRITFEGQLLLKGAHDSTVITLLK
ncbi:hypothetical protein HK101_009776 [Irineochytrium annulatum]|nr:hypothetical protein HK101_009776 [Irineochytrium annulatum]